VDVKKVEQNNTEGREILAKTPVCSVMREKEFLA